MKPISTSMETLTNVLTVSQSDIWPRRAEYHVLTYAEEGFAPLNIHTRDSKLTKKQLAAFTTVVNNRNETGSLYPSAAVSAVPRALIRDLQNVSALRQHIEEFFRANAKSIHAKKLLLDFRTPSVQRFVVAAINEALACPEAAFIDEIVIVDDDAT